MSQAATRRPIKSRIISTEDPLTVAYQPNRKELRTPYNDQFEIQVRMDVAHFRPEEVSVVHDVSGSVLIEGRHEERNDGEGHVSRAITRRYSLPNDIDTDQMTCTWNTEGLLTITAPRLQAVEEGKSA